MHLLSFSQSVTERPGLPAAHALLKIGLNISNLPTTIRVQEGRVEESPGGLAVAPPAQVRLLQTLHCVKTARR